MLILISLDIDIFQGEIKEHHRTEKRIEVTKRTTQKMEVKLTSVQSSGNYPSISYIDFLINTKSNI